ncbi:MAG TPA: flagellin [Steroidobacteraceae bacterium]|jgi:flagellin|nr:flagellin [Steroidobacteraceae bacterium]
MSLVLNTNMASLVAQNSLTSSGMQLQTSLQQLSSGLRVNTAADDAAGYAIAQGMTSQIDGLTQAAQNANDGVSLTQTASGALSEVTTDLQTMRDLAVESLNATNSAGDRSDLNAQFQQLAADINSVASQTQFNGVNLLDGSFQGATFQVGANAGQTITVGNVASAATSNLGQLYSDGGGAYGYAGLPADGATSSSGTISVAVNGKTFTTNPVTITGVQSTDMAAVAAAVNQLSAQDGGIIATVTAGATGGITLSSTNSAIGTAAGVPTVTAGTFTDSTGATDAGITAGATGATTLGFSAGATAGTATAFTAVSLANGGFLNSSSVSTVDDSNLALTQIDAALQQLATTGADLGAYQNRFQAAITGLNTDSTNLTAAKSAIVDTDYAAATSSLSKAQILQQASTAMVAQANTIPQNILTLLQKLP